MNKGNFKKRNVPGNFQGLVQQAQKMKQDMERTQTKVKEQEFEAQSGGGMVKVKINGDYKILSLDIDPQVIDPNDKELLQDMVKAAISEAIENLRSFSQSEMSKITGGMNVPGLF